MTTKTKKMIGEYSEDHLLGVAKDVVAKKTKNSKLLDAAAEARIPKFNPSGKKTNIMIRDLGYICCFYCLNPDGSIFICFCLDVRIDSGQSLGTWWLLCGQ